MWPKNSAQENLELIEGVRRDDPKAKQRLYELYRGPIELMVTGKISRHDEVEELCQEIWKAIFEAIKNERIHEPEKLPGFIYRICRNKITDWIRAKYKKPPRFPLDKEIIDESDDGPESLVLTQEAQTTACPRFAQAAKKRSAVAFPALLSRIEL